MKIPVLIKFTWQIILNCRRMKSMMEGKYNLERYSSNRGMCVITMKTCLFH